MAYAAHRTTRTGANRANGGHHPGSAGRDGTSSGRSRLFLAIAFVDDEQRFAAISAMWGTCVSLWRCQ